MKAKTKSLFPDASGRVELTIWEPKHRSWIPMRKILRRIGLRIPEFVPAKYDFRGHFDLKGNVVVDNAVKQMARLLAGYSMTDRYINRMQFGSGNTSSASASDTALETPINPIKTISATSYPTDRSVKFQAFLLETEGTGFPIREAGLLFANTSPLLAARKTFETLTKSTSFVFEFNWTIYWAAVS